jgi:hypothetical protein
MNNLTEINNRLDLSFFENYNQVYGDNEVNDDPYFGIDITCNYYDVLSLSTIPAGPLFLSINIQSLQSKFEQLVQMISDLESSKIIIEVIAIQEIWDVRYPELLTIPGYKQLLFKKRRNMRGGGLVFILEII